MTQAQPSPPGGGATGPARPASGTGRPLARRVQARFFRAANVPMRAVLGLPFPTPLGRRLMLARIVGRKTGRVYRQPLSYVRDGDVLLTPGGGKWKLNLRDDHPVTLRLRGRDVAARPEVVRDPDEIGRLFALMADRNPAVLRFAGIRDAEGRPDPDKLATAIRFGFTIVRWHLDP